MVKLSGQEARFGLSGGSIAELMQTHPTFENRVRLAREFCSSRGFADIRFRTRAANAQGSLASYCKSCGAAYPNTELFCPNCGNSAG
jgi:pantoate kinase